MPTPVLQTTLVRIWWPSLLHGRSLPSRRLQSPGVSWVFFTRQWWYLHIWCSYHVLTNNQKCTLNVLISLSIGWFLNWPGPCSVPKWKNANGRNGATVLWNPSSERASGLLLLVLVKGGPVKKCRPVYYWFQKRGNGRSNLGPTLTPWYGLQWFDANPNYSRPKSLVWFGDIA